MTMLPTTRARKKIITGCGWEVMAVTPLSTASSLALPIAKS
jgi:hypothetical protein